jgi:hypothetical protein
MPAGVMETWTAQIIPLTFAFLSRLPVLVLKSMEQKSHLYTRSGAFSHGRRRPAAPLPHRPRAGRSLGRRRRWLPPLVPLPSRFPLPLHGTNSLYRFHSFVSFFYFPTTPTNRFSYCVSSLKASDMDRCFYLNSSFNHVSFFK